MLVEVDRM